MTVPAAAIVTGIGILQLQLIFNAWLLMATGFALWFALLLLEKWLLRKARLRPAPPSPPILPALLDSPVPQPALLPSLPSAPAPVAISATAVPAEATVPLHPTFTTVVVQPEETVETDVAPDDAEGVKRVKKARAKRRKVKKVKKVRKVQKKGKRKKR